MVASLFAAASVFGHSGEIAGNSCAPKPTKAPEAKPSCNPQPVCPPKPCCPERPEMTLNCAYNAPARVEVDSCSCWDFYFGASFIYWEAMQDNMEYAASLAAPASSTGFFSLGSGVVTQSEIHGHDFEYKPGFKILAGMNFDYDHWDGYAEYTWFSSNTHSSINSGSDSSTTRVGVTPVKGNPFMLDAVQTGGNFSVAAFNDGSQEWKLSFQSLDAAIARTYYVGTKLIFRSILGARFAWFTQQAEQTFTNDGTLAFAFFPAGTYSSKQNFSSWGAGLMAGLNTKWMLGEGFSMLGNGSVDLLYTRVQTSNSKFSWQAVGSLPAIYNSPDDRPDFVMPHMNLEFGFAWGSYLDCYKWHVDFAATYNFQVFWNANLFRQFTDFEAALISAPNGNLYMHGLNLSARVDF